MLLLGTSVKFPPMELVTGGDGATGGGVEGAVTDGDCDAWVDGAAAAERGDPAITFPDLIPFKTSSLVMMRPPFEDPTRLETSRDFDSTKWRAAGERVAGVRFVATGAAATGGAESDGFGVVVVAAAELSS
jgi:hypothetical protein